MGFPLYLDFHLLFTLTPAQWPLKHTFSFFSLKEYKQNNASNYKQSNFLKKIHSKKLVLHIKQIANENRLYGTGNSNQCSVVT